MIHIIVHNRRTNTYGDDFVSVRVLMSSLDDQQVNCGVLVMHYDEYLALVANLLGHHVDQVEITELP